MENTTKRGYSELQGLYAIYEKKKCAESRLKFNPPYGRVSKIFSVLKQSGHTFTLYFTLHLSF